MKLKTIFTLTIIVLLFVMVLPVSAAAETFPDVIPLPVGWQAEGIAVGRGSTFYSGSLATGAIFRGDLRSGEGSVFVPAQGRPAVGLKVDDRSNALFVAGGPSGLASVYDAATGDTLAVYTLTGPGSFINDVVVTRQAAYFTNSSMPVLYSLPLGPAGELPDPSAVVTIPLGGDYVQQPGFNANGIDATQDGRWLIIVQSNTGLLFRVDPVTGDALAIDLGGATVVNGDGILFVGNTLYVVQNQLNQIAVVRLNADLTAGEVVGVLTNPNFAVPTTIARFGDALYAVNARFGFPNPPTQPFEVVRVPLH